MEEQKVESCKTGHKRMIEISDVEICKCVVCTMIPRNTFSCL
jgi:hypothetical protein